MKRFKEEMLRRYNKRFETFGYDPKSLGWMKARQTVRFLVLTEIGDLHGSSILDVGCGFGDLLGFCKRTGISVKYTGCDINPNFIRTAREKYPEGKFVIGDINDDALTRKFDWVLATGIFEFRHTDIEKRVKLTLAKMFNIARKGVAADFLSSYVDYSNEQNFHAAPEKIFKYAKSLSKRVTLRHDYMPYEFCVYIYKKEVINYRNVFAEFDEHLVKKIGTNELFPLKGTN